MNGPELSRPSWCAHTPAEGACNRVDDYCPLAECQAAKAAADAATEVPRQCSQRGCMFTSAEAPELCPVCGHPFFELAADFVPESVTDDDGNPPIG